MGLLMLPFLSFSQQQEEPKRVSIIVTAKEIAPQKEIVQLPADNLPKITNSKPTKETLTTQIATIKKNNTTLKTTIASKKDGVVVKKLTTPTTMASAKKAPIKPVEVSKKSAIVPVKKTEITRTKLSTKQERKPAKATSEKTTATAKAPNVDQNKEVRQVGDKTEATSKLEISEKEVVKSTNSANINSFSYIWIGIFLIVAGLVLGLLFGKPAFLISFVGVVFIALGLII